MSHPFAGFYRGKRVLVTGHTGFQGGWIVSWLKLLDAQVCGYGLPPQTRPNFFDSTILDRGVTSIFADIRDRNSLANTFAEFQPEMVIHCAAQSSTQFASKQPVETLSTNIMGTVHLLEEARLTRSVRGVVIVNGSSHEGKNHSQRNAKPRGICDLLEASAASVELASFAFNHAFFKKSDTAVAIMRGPEAIGGGDWREGRLVPDLVRRLTAGEPIRVSSAAGLRICHVLELAGAAISLAQSLFENGPRRSGVCEFRPKAKSTVSATELAKQFVKTWRTGELAPAAQPKQMGKSGVRGVRERLGWSSVLRSDQAIAWTAEWYRAFCADPSSAGRVTEDQIRRYMQLTSA